MPGNIPASAANKLKQYGILGHKEQETLYEYARLLKSCAKTTGVPLAGGAAVMGANAGAVVLPVVGSVPGAVAAALGGLLVGTGSCVALNLAAKQKLKEIANDPSLQSGP